jgi:hypothetical protein
MSVTRRTQFPFKRASNLPHFVAAARSFVEKTRARARPTILWKAGEGREARSTGSRIGVLRSEQLASAGAAAQLTQLICRTSYHDKVAKRVPSGKIVSGRVLLSATNNSDRIVCPKTKNYIFASSMQNLSAAKFLSAQVFLGLPGVEQALLAVTDWRAEHEDRGSTFSEVKSG